MNSIDYMKLAAFKELEEALKVKKINDELCEYLASSLRWLLYYEEKHNIKLPEKEKIAEILSSILDVNNKLPPSYRTKNKP